MSRRLSFSQVIVVSFLLASCAGNVPPIPTVIGPTVTLNPNPTASMTPFSPLAYTPTLPPPTPAATLPPTQTAEATSTFTPAPPTAEATSTFTPAPPTAFVPAAYTLNVMLDYANHALSIDETIIYTNSTGETLTNLVLAVEPNLWKNCFVPGNLTVNGQPVIGSNLSGDRLEIPLAEPLVSSANLTLFVNYDLHLPAADVYHVFGYNDYQLNLVDWYPFIVPYDLGQGWLLHPPANVGEHLVYDEQVFEMTLHLTDPNVAAVVAASAPAERISFGWYYQLENVRSFAFSVSTGYQTHSSTVDDVKVTSYSFDSESSQAQAVLDNVVKAVATYSSLFGPDPYTSLAIVESPFYDGLEYDGLFFLSRDFYTADDGTVLNNLIDIAVHETAHQWWFGSVGSDQAMEPWLDEAMATYSERLFYEQNYPEVTAWQVFRIDAYNPTGWVDSDIYHGVDFRTYANAVYLRGAQFLQALRGRVGDDAFFAFLKDYATQMAGKRATSADFFAILRKDTRVDISDIIRTYFQNPH